MAWQFRKTKTFGPIRLSASKRGLGVSGGAGPLRVSRGADGKLRRTVRIPGTGLYDTQVIGSGTSADPAPPSQPAPFDPASMRAQTPAEVSEVDAAGVWALRNLQGDTRAAFLADLNSGNAKRRAQALDHFRAQGGSAASS